MTFVDALHTALERPHRDDAANAVHDVVANALRALDPGAEVRATHYFTHSFVPDLVVQWGPQSNRRERHVHLRFSVRTKAFGQDLDLLADESPLFLGMTDANDLHAPEWAGDGHASNGTLVTQSQAVDDLISQARSEGRIRKATGALVRVGHGVIDEPRAERVGATYRSALEAMAEAAVAPQQAGEQVEAALSLLLGYLPEAGHIDVERALQSEWIRAGGDPYNFPSSTPWNPELLDVESLREVLLSLLSSEQPVQPETWQRNAGFISVEDLGRVLGRTLRGGAFNAMAHALLQNWTAKWVWSERLPSPPLIDTYDWLVENGIIGLEVNDLRTWFADDGRHFKDKEGGSALPLLSEAQQMLSQRGLQQVGLRGPMEGIRYEPLAAAGDVFSRIRQILNAPGAGNYRVQSVVAGVPGADAAAKVELDRQIIDLEGRSTPVATLARMAARFFSRATRPDGLDHFLATGDAPTADAEPAA